MNMKKVFASVMAGALAISAIATSVSATNDLLYSEDQKASTKTWDFTGKSYPITWTGEAVYKFSEDTTEFAPTASTYEFDFNQDVDSAKLKLTGKVNGANTTKTITLKKVDSKTYTISFKDGLTTISNGIVPLNYFDDVNVEATLSYTIKAAEETKADADTAAGKSIDVDVTVIEPTIAAVVDDPATTEDETKAASTETLFDSFNTTITADEGVVGDASTVHGPIFSEGEYEWFGEDLVADVGDVDEDAAKEEELEKYGIDNLLVAIQDTVGDAYGAKLTFNLYVPTKDEEEKSSDKIGVDDIIKLSSTTDTQNFGIALNFSASRKFQAGTKVADDQTAITFDWDKLKNGLAAGTIFEMAIKVTDGKNFQIDSITLDVPAATLTEIAAGEGATETTAALGGNATTAAAVTEAAATESAKNPTTGNAPIALAVIPVAIVAAAVIAKKRS